MDDDSLDFLKYVGTEQQELPNDYSHGRCFKCRAFIVDDDDGGWDRDYLEYYCSACLEKYNIETYDGDSDGECY